MASFTAEEREHYRRMVGMIVQGDPEKKRKLDVTVRQALASARAAIPGADDETMVAFFASVAVIMARVLATPLQDAASMTEAVFDNYTIAAARLLGAYDPDNPDVPNYAPEQAAEDAAGQRAREMDDLLSGGYL